MRVTWWTEALLDGYIAHGWAVVHGGVDPAHEWAFDAVQDVVEEAPVAELWAMVMALVQRAPVELLNYVAAGPLEELLCRHGPAIIDDVLLEAARDPNLRRALGGVWGERRMDPEVARRLRSALRRWQRQSMFE